VYQAGSARYVDPSLDQRFVGFSVRKADDSRLFLGGKERYFTDDYPPNYTQIGLHGHYDGKGDLNAASVNKLHLKEWTRLGQPDGISPSRMAEMLEVDKAGPRVRC
jgi:hypothetical protein